MKGFREIIRYKVLKSGFDNVAGMFQPVLFTVPFVKNEYIA